MCAIVGWDGAPIGQRHPVFYLRAMNRRKILVIAPEHNESQLPKIGLEIAAIERHHDATVLRGVVRDSDIAQAIVSGDFEIMWFVAHGTESGIELNDGLLSTDAVVQYVRADETRLCVLNTCNSEDMAIAIASQSGADVICTIGDIDNRDAIRLGELLAGELAYCETYREAYELVASDGGRYRYYEGHGTYRSYRRGEDVDLLRMMYEMRADIKLLKFTNFVTATGLVAVFLYMLIRGGL